MRPNANRRVLLALVGLAVASACKNLDVPNLNAPAIGDLETVPTRSGVATAVQGLVDELRSNQGGVVATFGAFGREGYNLDPSNPQAPANIYVRLDQDAGGGFWTTAYRMLRQGKVVLSATDKVADLTAAEKEGIRGFTKTLEALALLYNIMAMDQSGAALDVNAQTGDPLPDIKSKAEVYTRILQLLDEAATNLNAAGSSFAFGLPPGFAGFNTPATFLKFNKAIRARANIYTKNYTGALTDLAASFLSTTAPLTLGVYLDFSTGTGDAANPIYDPTTRQRFAHPSILRDAQLQADGVTRDTRATSKVAPIDSIIRHGFPVSEKLTVYTSAGASIPVIRNEELILLRAEANLALGSTSAAIADINVVRAAASGLPPISDPYVANAALRQPATLLDELLYEKRYSLFWEFGTTWIDARNYGKLALLPHDRTGDKVFPNFALPNRECSQRSPAPAGCTVPAGL
ncbi:MAG: RagB/SusD family nutrient uptake outer membrane protein [Gemmatimonadetes bacterium]|nr:RagB/SusD family nutrient uptake outer membrane protein [Gemmatimonadota bacterium]